MATLELTRRLPGIAFEAEPPPSPVVLPRMDVAGFVGFASSGPIDTPVAVEDFPRFASIFGDDAPLVWDPARGERVYAQLAPSVRAFFRNGGRRAWVVRVAGRRARRTRFEVPCLAARRSGEPLGPAELFARARGSWADAVRVGAALTTSPALVVDAAPDASAFSLELGAVAAIVPGDVVRLRSDDHELMFVVDSVQPADTLGVGVGRGRMLVTLASRTGTALWLERLDSPHGAAGDARFRGADGRRRVALAYVAEGLASPPDESENGQLRLTLEVAFARAPVPGSFVRVAGLVADRELWLVVREIRAPAEAAGSPPDEAVDVVGTPFWVVSGGPEPAVSFPAGAVAEKLTLELFTRRGESQGGRVGELGLAPGHPRYVGDLPTDEHLYGPRDPAQGPDPALWAVAADPRFPLAGFAESGDSDTRPVFYPIGLSALPEAFLGAVTGRRSALGRDGLARFDEDLFLDRRVRAFGLEALLAEADFIRYQQPQPKALTGIHALLALDEVTLVAVPDAIHRRWRVAARERAPAAPASEPVPRPDPARFLACAERVLSPGPSLHVSRGPDAEGGFALSWTALAEPDVIYVLEETEDAASWDHATAVYSGAGLGVELYGRPRGTYFFRVQARAGRNVSDWSPGVVVRVGPSTRWISEREDEYRVDALLALQRSLLRMCGARGDMFCVLSMPEHFREDDAIAHVGELRSSRDLPAPGVSPPHPQPDRVRPLDGSELRALGYGAIYHPWLTTSIPDLPERFRRTPPDGAATGIVARRAATRGAWIAPANEAITDVVTLTPSVRRETFASLQAAHVNEVRQEPDGFVCLSADTLTDDEQVRPISVRRLLALLRRTALLYGPDYVFEPNNGAFRRSVQRGFEAVLGILFELGAFAGNRPDDGFRVVVGDPPNTRQSVDLGRLIVELRVAPSRPLEFLTVRLVNSAEQGFRVEGP